MKSQHLYQKSCWPADTQQVYVWSKQTSVGECIVQTNLGSRIIKPILCVLWQKTTCNSGKYNLSVLCISVKSLYEVRHSHQHSVMVWDVSVERGNERFVAWENYHNQCSCQSYSTNQCQRNRLSHNQTDTLCQSYLEIQCDLSLHDVVKKHVNKELNLFPGWRSVYMHLLSLSLVLWHVQINIGGCRK